ncbi:MULTISPECIES: hypothetical protein [Paenibacillus]|uniref:hypothetical protein n=1 Tax=Paenibacillus TaxID=44249 RepID=UPI000A531F53|nr:MULTISPECIES: hypothetical protein [Paenibacillus]
MELVTGEDVDSAVGGFVAAAWELLLLLEQLVNRSIDTIAEAIKKLAEDVGLRMLRVNLVIRIVVPSLLI